MEKNSGTNWLMLVRIGFFSLIVYNLVFAWGKFFSEYLSQIITPIFEAIQSSLLALTFIELIGIISVFVDLMGRWELLGEKKGLRVLRTFIIAFLLMAFIFKIFINYLDSAYLES